MAACEEREEVEPEPEEEVDLLVDDVLGEDAEAVVPLHPARRPHRRHVAADRLREGRAQRAHVHLSGGRE